MDQGEYAHEEQKRNFFDRKKWTEKKDKEEKKRHNDVTNKVKNSKR